MINKYNTPVITYTATGIALTSYRNTLWIVKGDSAMKVSKVRDLWFDISAESNRGTEIKHGVCLSMVYDMIEDMNLGWESDSDLERIDAELLDLPCMTEVVLAGLTPSVA